VATFPALIQLVRMLGRADALASLGVDTEPDPDELSATQRQRLSDLIDQRLDSVAVELLDEAAASDDVNSRVSALQFVGDRIAGFRDLLNDDQLQRLTSIVESGASDWG